MQRGCAVCTSAETCADSVGGAGYMTWRCLCDEQTWGRRVCTLHCRDAEESDTEAGIRTCGGKEGTRSRFYL